MGPFRVFVCAIVVSAFAPGNPLFGLRTDGVRPEAGAPPSKLCAEHPSVCRAGGRVMRGLETQAAFVVDAAYCWIAKAEACE